MEVENIYGKSIEVSECRNDYVICGEYGGKFCDTRLKFQDGPVQQVGINGCEIEEVLICVVDRLRYLNVGKFECAENAHAIRKIEEALMWLDARTRDRVARGVEGTLEP